MNTAPLPPITEYELSRFTAEAGIQARHEAAALPGDPAQIGALMRAATAQPASTQERGELVNGIPLYPLNFAVTLATTELDRFCRKMEDKPSELQTILRMLVCFHLPVFAYQTIQSTPEPLAVLDAEGMKLAGHWGVAEMAAFGQFIARMKAQNPCTQSPNPEPDKVPGKSKPGGKAKR